MLRRGDINVSILLKLTSVNTSGGDVGIPSQAGLCSFSPVDILSKPLARQAFAMARYAGTGPALPFSTAKLLSVLTAPLRMRTLSMTRRSARQDLWSTSHMT